MGHVFPALGARIFAHWLSFLLLHPTHDSFKYLFGKDSSSLHSHSWRGVSYWQTQFTGNASFCNTIWIARLTHKNQCDQEDFWRSCSQFRKLNNLILLQEKEPHQGLYVGGQNCPNWNFFHWIKEGTEICEKVDDKNSSIPKFLSEA